MDPEQESLETVVAYHERTKHASNRYALSPGYLDWATRPDPFRRYEGAPLLPLEEAQLTEGPSYDELFQPGRIPPLPLDRGSVSRLFYDSLALSAWKEYGGERWALRANPSSGNLHPTEAYLLSGPVADLTGEPALRHYSPYHHGLERRLALSEGDWAALANGLPPGAAMVGLTSILWRESWKYGERAFRYCLLDAGHALAALDLAAACLGWETRLLESLTDAEMSVLLGVHGQAGIEAEHPEGVLALYPASDALSQEQWSSYRVHEPAQERLRRAAFAGAPNQLSADHRDWPVLAEVARASLKHRAPEASFWFRHPVEDAPPPASSRRDPSLPARAVLRQRRSAQAMDGHTGVARDVFFGMLERILPRAGGRPFSAIPWWPGVHLALFVHRVEGLDPGLYLLVREPDAREELRSTLRSDWAWKRPPGCPDSLDLYLLSRGDARGVSRTLSCHQEIASDGAFAVAMLGRFEPLLRDHGPWFYRRLHWEAGMIGQVLYLEAEAAGVRGTGIGCFFDDEVHRLLGIPDRRYQVLYHFTVGGPVVDRRLRTLPAYSHRPVS